MDHSANPAGRGGAGAERRSVNDQSGSMASVYGVKLNKAASQTAVSFHASPSGLRPESQNRHQAPLRPRWRHPPGAAALQGRTAALLANNGFSCSFRKQSGSFIDAKVAKPNSANPLHVY